MNEPSTTSSARRVVLIGIGVIIVVVLVGPAAIQIMNTILKK